MLNRIDWLLSCALMALATLLLLNSCPAQPNPAADAGSAELYAKNCALCHGKDLTGSPGMAPGLLDIKPHWKSAEEMARYLADPREYAMADPRLRENLGKYSMRMPNFPSITSEQHLALAKWLLAQQQ